MREWNRRRAEANPEAHAARLKAQYQKKIATAEKHEAKKAAGRAWAKQKYPQMAEALIAKSKAYYAANAEVERAKDADYRAANVEACRQRQLAWKAANPGAAAAATKRWNQENPGWHPARRATKFNATPKWLTPEQHDAIAQIYRKAKETGMTVDHIVPLQGATVTGLHVPWNLQLLTHSENSAKGNRLQEAA